MFGPGGEFMYDCFVDLLDSGFSENQALKLMALMSAACAHPSLWGDEDDEDLPKEEP